MWARRKKNHAASTDAPSIHTHYGSGALPPPGVKPPPIVRAAQSGGSSTQANRLPPGVNPPGMAAYTSMYPSAAGVRPDKE